MNFNKKLKSLLSILCLVAVFFSVFTGCDSEITSEITTGIVETTVENPATGLRITMGLCGVAIIGLLVFMICKKKTYFSKIYGQYAYPCPDGLLREKFV